MNNDDEDLEMDLNEEEIKRAEAKRAEKFKFNEEFDDFESYKKRQKEDSTRQKKQDTSSYYHEYFRNKSDRMFGSFYVCFFQKFLYF